MTHRWMSLILGLVLVIEALSGVVLLYDPEIHHALNASAYDSQGGPATVSMPDAAQVVATAHPDFAAAEVVSTNGVYSVTDYTTSWNVDPATGKILGRVAPAPGWLRFTENLHECALSCQDEPGYLKALEKNVPHTGWLSDDGQTPVTVASLLLGALGLMLLFLTLSGLWLWFPRPKRWRTSMNVRFRRGRFARDTDLHKAIGVAALLPLLIWGFTGAGFELGPVKKAWYAALPGSERTDPVTISPGGPKATAPIGLQAALDAAQHAVPNGRVVSISTPTPDDTDTPYDIWVSSPHDPYGRTDYPGNIEVTVDQLTAATTIPYGYPGNTLTQNVFDNWNYPVHTGYVVNGWWRIPWVIFGLTPLALMITGLSTWLVRRRTNRNRRNRRKLKAPAATANRPHPHQPVGVDVSSEVVPRPCRPSSGARQR